MRPPRGVRLVNQHVEDGVVSFDIRVAWWRKALLALKALRGARVKLS